MKTARFKKVVDVGGKPKTYLPFLPADEDATLTSALNENRIMSISRTLVGQRKDFGLVGLESGKGNQILIFPKSLKSFEGCRIVAIDYSLVDEALEGSAKPARKPESPPSVVPATKQVSGGKSAGRSKSRKKPTLPPTKSEDRKMEKAEAPSDIPPPEAKETTPKQKRKTNLKEQLCEVLEEWRQGHDVKANSMLVAIVEAL